MKLLASLVILLSINGCSYFQKAQPVVCDVSKAVSSLLAAQVATQLTCVNLDVVSADISAKVGAIQIGGQPICSAVATTQAAFKVGLVDKAGKAITQQSAIGDVICGPIIDALASGALAQIPTTWGCSGGPLTDTIKAQLLAACQKAI